MDYYPIAVTGKGIYAINTEKERNIPLCRLPDSEKDILAACISDKGIYHAQEKMGFLSDKTGDFKFNYVLLFDTISGKSLMAVYPNGWDNVPFEHRVNGLNFSFVKAEGSLRYVLNDQEGVLFQDFCNNEGIKAGPIGYSQNKLYLGRKRIGKFKEAVLSAGLVDAKSLERLAKKKNVPLHRRLLESKK